MDFFNIVNDEKRSSEKVMTSIDPRTNQKLWNAPVATEADLNDAVKSAREAFKKWKIVPVEDRQALLLRLADKLEASRAEIHEILAKETGKSGLLTTIEIDDTLKFIKFNASHSLPDEVEFEDDTVKIISTHPPIGVVGAICPWNFPLVLAAAKIAASLVMGNCIIVKPSPFTPYATLKLAELALPIFPPGVFQVLNGDNDVGRLMTLHEGIDKITFTGSTATGRKVAESATKTLKRVTLELGGNDASIICPDVDVQSVAQKVAAGCLFHSGQMCVATKRVYVHKDIFEEFRSVLVKAVEATEVDISGQKPTLFSPIQNKMQYQIVKDLIADSKANGHSVVGGGDSNEQPGLFIRPCVVDRPPDDAKVVQMEQFGPIIPLLEWSSEDEVISRVNDTESGLGSCVWAKDATTAERIARQLEVGSVWINSFEIPSPHGYFSGWKQSGIGGEWGKQGLRSYSQTQTLQIYK
ncbi:aldehyde dehydrogenase domain-containing protein [Dactylonectria macrodidyma]|uniref:aldehyde dehydrogenase (NAD(+)) n=1 Tax=Dactylonectria macrodidyma TaxID=307937 RepID=A0A9P9JD51_9HYPO|nr:aldehyde dehydrogenase domain-containing protein [Dactylonectria macrodidyma]